MTIVRFIFRKTRAHCENKYVGPIAIFRKLKSGLYVAVTEHGELIRIPKREFSLNTCDCECHDNVGIMHFMPCCSMTYEQRDNKDEWLEKVLANPEIQYA